MASAVHAYLLNTDRLVAKIAADDSMIGKFKQKYLSIPSYRKQLHQQCAHHYPYIDQCIEDSSLEDNEGVYAGIMMRQLLEGRSNRQGVGFVYAMLLEAICREVGDPLDFNEWSPCSVRDFFAIPYTTSALPFSFPPADDGVMVARIRYQDIVSTDVNIPALVVEQNRSLSQWFSEAIQYKVDIYLFCH